MSAAIVTTPRLLLRPLAADDLDHLVRLFADPAVMRFLSPTGALRSRAETEEAHRKLLDHWQEYGYGVWSVVEQASGAFAGRCGLRHLPELQAVEILWTLFPEFWGQGYATEAARACLRYGFETMLERVISFTWTINERSRRVMEKLGMRYEKTAPYAGLPHVWYAVTRDEFVTDSPKPHA
jgi:RimJ/RimL family protein N-acetyltransferase